MFSELFAVGGRLQLGVWLKKLCHLACRLLCRHMIIKECNKRILLSSIGVRRCSLRMRSCKLEKVVVETRVPINIAKLFQQYHGFVESIDMRLSTGWAWRRPHHKKMNNERWQNSRHATMVLAKKLLPAWKKDNCYHIVGQYLTRSSLTSSTASRVESSAAA